MCWHSPTIIGSVTVGHRAKGSRLKDTELSLQVLTGVQVLAATSICGVLQAVVGGQPLLIVGVAEPIVLLYKVRA